MLRKYTVIKHQKEAFGKSPSMQTQLMLGEGWFLSPLLLVFSFLVNQLMNMCLSYPRESMLMLSWVIQIFS